MITYCLLGYFRISMWPVKTSAWSVSGLSIVTSIMLKGNDQHQNAK